MTARRGTSALVLAVALVTASGARPAAAQELPPWLRDRGTGVRTSLLGTYVRDGELLVYPFFEYYDDADIEYKPSELGFTGTQDVRGHYRASEGILFLGYSVGADLALEFEAAVIRAEIERSPDDTLPAAPRTVEESGLGDVEAQIRWRFLRETERRPEAFAYFETVFPLQRNRNIIGTSGWEFAAGIGAVRGFGWGTVTVRAAAEYADGQLDAGEYAVEYLRRLSRAWRVAVAVEGVQLDEVSLITEVQWRFLPRAYLKLNNSWGLTQNATDLAPEVGIMFSF